jgi:hypothetical protein
MAVGARFLKACAAATDSGMDDRAAVPAPAPTPVPTAAPGPIPRLDEAIALLRALAGPHGLHASRAATANYRAVFARDGVMAGIAGLLVGDAVVTAGLVRTLEGLRDRQGPEGQVASNFEVRADGTAAVSFGTLAPRLDAPLWYLAGVSLAVRTGAVERAAFDGSVRRVVALLDALEYNGRHLLYAPAGGNWADEWLTEGYVLHDQALRAWALRLAGAAWGEPAWTAKADAIGAAVAERFAPAPDAPRPHPVASYTPLGRRDLFDLAGCALLALAGAAPAMAATTLDWIDATWLAAGALPPVFHPVVDEAHPDWPALRGYHLYAFRNHPHEYHNGGVWPVWLGWLGLALARTGRAAALARLRAAVAAHLARHPGWAFEEYLHGRTGAPGGVPQMGYSATGLVLLAVADRADRLGVLDA